MSNGARIADLQIITREDVDETAGLNNGERVDNHTGMDAFNVVVLCTRTFEMKRKNTQRLSSVLITLICTITLCMSSLTACAKSTYQDPTVLSSASAERAIGFQNFVPKAKYTNGQFADVQSSDWFYNDVKNVFEIGMMIGNSNTTFNPSGNVTIAETATIAARLNKVYTTGTKDFNAPPPGEAWYIPYVNYDLEHGILDGDEAGTAYSKTLNANKPATRAEFAAILSRSLPDEAMEPINTVDLDNIPDVDENMPYSAEILKMYQVGILIGSDEEGTFLPETNIQRSAVAAIVNRLADPGQRKTYQPEKQNVKDYTDMRMIIGETEVPVTWERNPSVEEIKKLLPLRIEMSMYGGFEQVGAIGENVTRDDHQTVANYGDVVLYAGNQIVVFYGSNSWSYTRLGHIELSENEITDLLSHGDVTLLLTE